jgi:hypothetical protein
MLPAPGDVSVLCPCAARARLAIKRAYSDGLRSKHERTRLYAAEKLLLLNASSASAETTRTGRLRRTGSG